MAKCQSGNDHILEVSKIRDGPGFKTVHAQTHKFGAGFSGRNGYIFLQSGETEGEGRNKKA